MDRRIGWATGLTGALAGLLTWLLSEPYIYTVRQHGTVTAYGSYTLGSFYGWFAHMTLGAMIAGSLAFVISLFRTEWRRAILAGAIGAVVGGALVCGADALSDWVDIRAIQRAGFGKGFVFLYGHMMWFVLTSAGMAFAIAVAAQPTAARFRRAAIAAIVAAVAGYAVRQVIEPIEVLTQQFDDITTRQASALRSHGALTPADIKEINLRAWREWSPSRLLDWVVTGMVMGLSLSFADAFLRSAFLRLELGRNEGRTYPLDKGPNRIGTSEGLEVRVPFQAGALPLQAMIDPRQEHWVVTDLGGQGLFVNGYPVREALLREGDVIQTGPYIFRLVLGREGRTQAYVPSEVTFLEPPTPVEETPKDHRFIDPFGGVIPLKPGAWTLGRGDSSQIRLDYDSRVSRQHALLEITPGAAQIQNLSQNGTMVNGQPIKHTTSLADGDKVIVGGTTLQYRR